MKAPCVLTSAVRHGDTVCRSERWRDQEKKAVRYREEEGKRPAQDR